MSLKTFSAMSMPEALALVRRDLGSDAVILHTRSYKRGGVLGLGAKTVIEITAMSGTELAKRRQPTRKKPVAPNPVKTTKIANPSPKDEPLAGDLIRRTYAAAQAEMRGSAQAFPTSQHPVTQQPPAAQARPTAAIASPHGSAIESSERFTKELAAVRELVQRVAQRQEAESHERRTSPPGSLVPPDLPDPLVDFYTKLIQQEVGEELAERIVREVHHADEAKDSSDADERIRRQLASLMPEADAGCLPNDAEPQADRPRIVALVGPTGVGKTTTVAKLAATFKLKQGRSVGVITLDTYRIAAVDQLRTYCSIIGCPLEVARQPDELAACLEKLSDCDFVIIDTAGRSQRDDAKLDELASFLEVAQPDETHLVLTATASQRVMLQIAERFERVKPDRVIFTKLDEAVTCGTLFNVVDAIAKRVSYVTTGQEVPHQIEPGDAMALAARVLGESPETASARVV
ncbi:MAG: flagellar biosynthesis protein FlhF [Planctomycetota bacterium]